MRPARFWKTIYAGDPADQGVLCTLCPHGCQLKDSELGRCRARLCKGGQLYAVTYGELAALGLDPIEKKPLRHFEPGTSILSFGSYGCNLTCRHCQNYEIAHYMPHTMPWTVEALVAKALSIPGNIGIAATYNEPTVQIEYVLDVFKACRAVGLKTVFVSNGYLQKEPLEELLEVTDAFNIDLKGFTEAFYWNQCGGHLEVVKQVIEQIYGRAHLEVSCLLIDGKNDSSELLEAQFAFLGGISSEIPVHISRAFPRYLETAPMTPIETLEGAKAIASQYLKYVYLGNVNFGD